MMEPLISMSILKQEKVFEPGEALEWEYQIDAVGENEVQAVEAAVLWYTEGKGDEDMGVHFFERFVSSDLEEDGDLRQLRRFRTVLPRSPLTYSGHLVKVRWCTRVRVFLCKGKQTFFEQPFQLGRVPAHDWSRRKSGSLTSQAQGATE